MSRREVGAGLPRVSGVIIIEDYRGYSAPRWVRPTVERLLASPSPKLLAGLAAVVLTDAVTADSRGSRLPRRRRRGLLLGRYHPGWRGQRAWIELVVDRIVADCPRYMRGLQLARDASIDVVLFHEIGHHLNTTLGAPRRSGEPAADTWSRALGRLHFRKRYAYLTPVMRLSRWFRRGVATRRRPKR